MIIEPLSDESKMAVAVAYTTASRSNDGAAMAALCAPEAVTWHNFDDRETPTAHTIRAMAWLHRTVVGIGWTDVALKTTSDGFVWQSVLTGEVSGNELRVHSCVVATIGEDGKVIRIAEYLDSAQTAVLSG